MLSAQRLLAAYLLDLAFGDPETLPHPVRGMGWLISQGERVSQPGTRSAVVEFVHGTALSLLTVSLAYAAGELAYRMGRVAEVVAAWTTLATGSLVLEAKSVIRALECGDVEQARRRVARIVGRDTEHLDEAEIARAVIETVAESLCDGIVAPLCYLAWGGVPLALAYKAVNTLDSTIGHREAPYTYFGRFAARLDDVVNFVPARCAAVAIVLACGAWRDAGRRGWKTWLRDGKLHASPNAGQTEAAMAGVLGVRLGGANSYCGQVSLKPFLGAEFRAPSASEARQAVRVMQRASVLACAAAAAWCWWRRRA